MIQNVPPGAKTVAHGWGHRHFAHQPFIPSTARPPGYHQMEPWRPPDTTGAALVVPGTRNHKSRTVRALCPETTVLVSRNPGRVPASPQHCSLPQPPEHIQHTSSRSRVTSVCSDPRADSYAGVQGHLQQLPWKCWAHVGRQAVRLFLKSINPPVCFLNQVSCSLNFKSFISMERVNFHKDWT